MALLDDVKANLILTHNEDDALLTRLLSAAVSYAEGYQHLTVGAYADETDMPPTTRQAVIMLLFMILFYALPTNLSMYVETENIGSPSAAALAVSASTFSATIFSLWFSRLYHRFRDWLLPFSLAVLGLSFITLGILPDMTVLLVSNWQQGSRWV